MKSVLKWSIRNSPAMNTLMVAIMLVGAISLILMHRELFPAFDLEIIQVTVPYPGAAPEEVEEGICQKIEESVRAIDGIKKLSSLSREGSGTVVLELNAEVPDVQKILNEVRSEVDRIPSFPLMAEDPVVKQITLRRAAIRVGVVGPESDDPEAEVKLRQVTEDVRDQLLRLPSVSQANIVAAKDYQIDIEISEDTLRKYGLTLQEVARLVRRQNIELPGGSMKTDSQEVLLRGKNKRLVGHEIAEIPLVTEPGGVVLTVGDLGVVRDEFVDTTVVNRINKKPGMVISIDKTASEDLLAIVKQVRGFIAEAENPGGYQLPEGYSIETWSDVSRDVADRLQLLTKNGLQGLILVFLMLAIFLEFRLAFWVALGIPVSILGACGILYSADQTLNMLTMFAFLMALGILVDDAIVIGENIFTHRQMGKGPVQAAVDGAYEVLPSVIASVTTTIIAFTPLWMVPGIMGKFIGVMPLALIAMLGFSLMESTFILPCHLGHDGGFSARFRRFWSKVPLVITAMLFALAVGVFAAHVLYPQPLPWKAESPRQTGISVAAYLTLVPAVLIILAHLVYPFQVGRLFAWLNVQSSRLLERIISRAYLPTLRLSLTYPVIVVSTAIAVFLLSIGLIRGGIVPFNAFPKLDSNFILADITYPDGTPSSVTDKATIRLEDTIWKINDQSALSGMPLVKITHRTVGGVDVSGNMTAQIKPVGSHAGSVGVELVDTSKRKWKSSEIVAKWREAVGEFPGTEGVIFTNASVGPGGTAIEFTVLGTAQQMEAMEDLVEKCKAKLEEYRGVFDVADDSRPGKWEFQLNVKDRAKAMGISAADLAETVRASYYGEEVMRLQRGRHEVKLMVRYPRDERRSLANLDDIRVRTGVRAERPLTELATMDVKRGYSTITRMDQLRSITITADVDEAEANAQEVVTKIKSDFLPGLLEDPKYAGIDVRWEGQQEQTVESVGGLLKGLVVAMVAMFAILTLMFRSYLQPLLILLIIPFGAIGAIAGHWLMGLEMTLFSLFGLVALTGVVVNDSIVLIDFINKRVQDGMPLREALMDAGRRRFRAVLCTSLTTIAGLFPLLMETSFQAQILVPMATSLCFGLMFTTALVLFLIPTSYLIYARLFLPKVPLSPPLLDDAEELSDREEEAEVWPVPNILQH